MNWNYFRGEIENLSCSLSNLLCYSKIVECLSCGCGSGSNNPKRKVSLEFLNSFCCNYFDTVKIELPTTCCSNPTLFVNLFQTCCENKNPKAILQLLTTCCALNNVEVTLSKECCDNMTFLNLGSTCCVNKTLEIKEIDECCSETVLGIVYINLHETCCSNVPPLQTYLNLHKSCCEL